METGTDAAGKRPVPGQAGCCHCCTAERRRQAKVRTSHSHASTVMSGVQMWGQHVLFFVCRLLVVNYNASITRISNFNYKAMHNQISND